MVNDLGAKNPHAKTVGHLLRVSLNLHVKCQYHCVPETDKREVTLIHIVENIVKH